MTREVFQNLPCHQIQQQILVLVALEALEVLGVQLAQGVLASQTFQAYQWALGLLCSPWVLDCPHRQHCLSGRPLLVGPLCLEVPGDQENQGALPSQAHQEGLQVLVRRNC